MGSRTFGEPASLRLNIPVKNDILIIQINIDQIYADTIIFGSTNEFFLKKIGTIYEIRVQNEYDGLAKLLS